MKYAYIIYADNLELFQEHRNYLFAVDVPDAMIKYDEMVKRYNKATGEEEYLTCAEMELTEKDFLEKAEGFDMIYVEPLKNWIESYD